MSNLSELLPAGSGAKVAKFVASGTLASGQTVALKTDGTVEAVGTLSQGAGTPVVFEAGDIGDSNGLPSVAFDSNSNKIVIAYTDVANSGQGTVIVGTVSGTSISYGTAVVFETGDTSYSSAVFDSNSNKIVIAYRDGGDSNHGKAIVGTVSGTSISFGTAVTFETANSDHISATFDSNSNKVVIAYRDDGNNSYGTAIVGTVSGTSISFGTAVVYASVNAQSKSMAFDSNLNKVIIAFRNFNNSGYSWAVVGTVSGTGISFGTAVVYSSTGTEHLSVIFDSSNNKAVLTSRDSSNKGIAVVGTVSGTSISFGSAVIYSGSSTADWGFAVFDSNSNKVVISYSDLSNSSRGTVIDGTVSGTSITFGTALVFINADANYIGSGFDSNLNKVVTAYQDTSNSNYGTSVVIQTASSNNTSFIGITDAAISNSATGEVVVQGGVSEKVTGLTTASDYYVQTDGTLNTATSVANYNIASASYTQAFSVASQDTLPSAIAFNPAGTKMFIAGNQGNDIGEYTLSTAFDVGSASFVDSFSVSGQETTPTGLAFNADGTRMFVNGESSNTVHEYALSTGFDVSTASYTDGFSTAAQDSNSQGVTFNTDGTKMFVTGESTKKINEYALTSGFDVSTASFVDGFSVVSQADQPKDTQFNSDGTEMYVVSRSAGQVVYKYTLTTGFDVSTASYANVSFSVANQETSPQGLAFSANGSKMYVCGYTGQDVNEYATSATVTNSTTVPAGRALSATSILLEG